jgi:hypothetical protein
VKSSAHVATVCVFKKHEQLFRGLESIFETNNERMLSVGQHIPFSFSILHQVISHDLLLVQDLHSKLFA